MRSSRITLGQLMCAIAVLGAVFAIAPAPLAISLSALLLVIGEIRAASNAS